MRFSALIALELGEIQRSIESTAPRTAISRSLTIGATACEARLEFYNHLDRFLQVVGAKESGIGISRAEMSDPIEDLFGAAVPELPTIENSIDPSRRIAGFDSPRVDRAAATQGIRFAVVGVMDALRRHGVIAVDHRIEPTHQCDRPEPKTRQREIRSLELVFGLGIVE